MGQVKWKIFIQHTVLATLPSTYQNLLKLVEIDKNAVFLDTVYNLYVSMEIGDRAVVSGIGCRQNSTRSMPAYERSARAFLFTVDYPD